MKSILENCGIYVVHAKKGYEIHEKRVIELFGRHSLDFEFVTDGDPTLFTEEFLGRYFVRDIESRMSKGVVSCTLNHILSYEKAVQKGVEYALVFENDPCFLGDFKKKLADISDEIEALEKGFIISLENTTLRFPAYSDRKPGCHLYGATAGRAAGAYLIDRTAMMRVLEDLKLTKCESVIDWWHNSLLDRSIIKIFWAHPPLVEQGSHNGLLSSTISTKPQSGTARIRWFIKKTFKTYLRPIFREKKIIRN